MKVMDFLAFARIVSTLAPETELEISIQDNLFKVAVSDNPIFYAATKLK